MKFNKAQLEAYADSLLELANISVGALVFGSFFAEKFVWWIMFSGIVLYSLMVVLAFYLRRNVD